MSIQCPVLAINANSSPSMNTGMTSLTSLRCVPPR